MTEDTELEAEIRATLERVAARPAPDRLLARVAAIPTDDLASRRLRRTGASPLRLGFSLASAGFAMVLIVGALLLRGGIGQGSGASSPSVPAHSTVPGTPGPTPGASATASPATPSPSAQAVTPSPSPAAGDLIPADFQPQSVTFVSADLGWVLGSTGCGSSTCPAIARTADGGRTWTRIPAPESPIGIGGVVPGSGVSGLRFADPLDGWVFGPGLWATHDGGQTWKQVTIPGLPGASVVALEAAAGTVHASAFDQAGLAFRVASSSVGSDAWRLSPITVAVGAGPVPGVQLVLAGQAGWLIENDRVVTAGARLVSGTWQTWQPPCLDVVGPAVLAAGSAHDLVAVCDVGQWATPQGEHLYRSTDGGQSFAETGPRLPVDWVTAIGAPSASRILAAGIGSNSVVEVVESNDGGGTWAVVLRPGQVSVTYLGFTTPTQGVMLTSGDAGQGRLLMTRDGGGTWAAVQF